MGKFSCSSVCYCGPYPWPSWFGRGCSGWHRYWYLQRCKNRHTRFYFASYMGNKCHPRKSSDKNPISLLMWQTALSVSSWISPSNMVFISSGITTINVADIIIFANPHIFSLLKEFFVAEITDRPSEVVESNAWPRVKESN